MGEGLYNIFRKYEFSPDASIDQHFLNSEDDISEIIALLEVTKDDVVFEVGAGIGTITKKIPMCRKVFAVELEARTFEILKEETAALPHIEPVNDDALSLIRKINFTKILSSTPFAICEPLLQSLFSLQYEKCVILFPKKFTDNILSKSTKLGLFADAFLRFNIIREIHQENFSPVPGTRTMLLTIKKREIPIKEEALKNASELERFVVSALYFQRDKKLKNALRETFCTLLGKTKRESEAIISKMGISDAVLSRYVENLNYEHYTKLLSETINALNLNPESALSSGQN
jgi:16S rRNA (adenine1518-N6/adenine1519-N6)-dimethyltransferase